MKIEIEHKLLELLDAGTIEKAYAIVNGKKIKNAFFLDSPLSQDEIHLLQEVLEVLEYAIIDYWKYSFDTKSENREKRDMFRKLCMEYFKMKQIIPLPESKCELMKHVLQLITFSYMGEKWEDMRRYLIENETVWKIEDIDSKEWDLRLFCNIYHAILYLVRKSSWEDLENSVKLINTLKEEQEKFEKEYLSNVDKEYKKGSALELASLYHLARTVELTTEYMLQGSPKDILEQLDYHFEKSLSYTQNAKIVELDLLLRMLHNTFKKMIFNSVWYVTNTVNSRVTKYIQLITKANKPVFELLYPQRVAIVEKGLLDPANKAIVVNLPTSSGKTMIAEFRILQALNQFADDAGWIVYVVPTKALVNQITAKLRRNLSKSPLNIKVQKMSGALEIDSFEEKILKSDKDFDILVTTPEKLSLLIRQGIEEILDRPLVLAIIDEAHNLGDEGRGLNLEMLLSIIKKDCRRANFLLLTPYIPNSDEVASWLDPQNPKSISIELNWQPNERVIGMFYPTGRGRKVKTIYKPLITSHETIELEREIIISETDKSKYSCSALKTKHLLTSYVTEKLMKSGNILVVAGNIKSTWSIAKELSANLAVKESLDERIILVKNFISAELGEDFPLVNYLDKGIGVHNAGLPDEIKLLMEWLMEEELLDVLVATTTIAQGINFPVSVILMTTYSYPYRVMPVRDFWNLAGRAGRMDQKTLGVVGIAVNGQTQEALKLQKYVAESAEDLVSVLVGMVNKALKLEDKLNLKNLAYIPEWSMFLQYVAHMYRQSQDLQNFNAEVELTLKRTYGYNTLDKPQKEVLLTAVKEYAQKLDGQKHLATLSDMTGFSPETIEQTIAKVKELNIKQTEWNGSRLFSSSSGTLRKLMGIMINIPEVKNNLNIRVPGKEITNSTLSSIIIDWVSGKDVIELSKQYFGGTGTSSVANCVTSVYSKISNFATWGLAAMQKLPGSGIDFGQLSEEDKRKLNNLPAMIFYGVNSDEAILMRMNNVPRSIATNMGNLYKSGVSDIYDSKQSQVNSWLNNLNENKWNQVVPRGKKITGRDYKKIWKKLSGVE